jgi:hypothetical protein
MQDGSANLTGNDGAPERLGIEGVSANLLPLLGVRPLLGLALAWKMPALSGILGVPYCFW